MSNRVKSWRENLHRVNLIVLRIKNGHSELKVDGDQFRKKLNYYRFCFINILLSRLSDILCFSVLGNEYDRFRILCAHSLSSGANYVDIKRESTQ